jgi:phosphatidylserine decarboxylase
MNCKNTCTIDPKNKPTLVDINCDPVSDTQPSYVTAGVKAELYFPRFMTDVGLPRLTKGCAKYKDPKSKADIPKYIKEYNVDWTTAKACANSQTAEECADKFKSRNDFFIREVDSNYLKQYRHPNPTSKTIISPAECRCVVYDSEQKAKELWIKGEKFSLKNLLNIDQHVRSGSINPFGKSYRIVKPNSTLIDALTQKNINVDNYFKQNLNVVVSRLAPQDYHRFHAPVSGKVVHIDDVDGNFYSVQPLVVNSKTNVFGRNKRVNLWIKTDMGIVVFSIIGATCVGTITLSQNFLNKHIKHGDEIGYFEFGGSTIVTVIPGRVQWCDKIRHLSDQKIETFVHVGEFLGTKN